MSSVEILKKDKFGNYISKTVDGCSSFAAFPVLTSSATGVLFNDLINICVGYTLGDANSQCFEFHTDGSWKKAFNLQNPLKYWGTSVTFGERKLKYWWILGGEPDGKSTEVWAGNPASHLMNFTIKLPSIVNQPCVVKISEREAFVSAIPKFESTSSNFAWIYNFYENEWTRLPNSLNMHSGPACGLLKNSTSKYIVLAGGYRMSTTEILNLESKTWTTGPDIGTDLYGGSMVSVSDGEELLLIGGYSNKALTQILRINSSMVSWETAGSLNDARFNSVATAVPQSSLPILINKESCK